MRTTESKTLAESNLAADEQAVFASFLTGQLLDPEVARRVQERAQAIRKRVFDEDGLLHLGVPAIRELRDELP